MRAYWFIKKGCKGYLASVVDTQNQTPKLEEIPVAKNFPDVFRNELPGLPPDREIEFTIDLAQVLVQRGYL